MLNLLSVNCNASDDLPTHTLPPILIFTFCCSLKQKSAMVIPLSATDHGVHYDAKSLLIVTNRAQQNIDSEGSLLLGSSMSADLEEKISRNILWFAQVEDELSNAPYQRAHQLIAWDVQPLDALYCGFIIPSAAGTATQVHLTGRQARSLQVRKDFACKCEVGRAKNVIPDILAAQVATSTIGSFLYCPYFYFIPSYIG